MRISNKKNNTKHNSQILEQKNPTQGPIDLSGEISVAKRRRNGEQRRTIPVDLQSLSIHCDPNRGQRDRCSEFNAVVEPTGFPEPEKCVNCPAGPEGEKGDRGPKGERGIPGPVGEEGLLGRYNTGK